MTQAPPKSGSTTTTNGIQVTVTPSYLEAESNPQANFFLFAYAVTITNVGEIPLQLRSRHWVIIDANGKREEVKGPGVVGEQPLLKPTESFTYNSFCPLSTHWGTMEGTYFLTDEAESIIEAKIGRFFLVKQN